MAIKAFCDGCDKELVQSDNMTRLRVDISGGDINHLTADFDLCAYCCKSLLKQADPRLWTRVGEPPSKRVA